MLFRSLRRKYRDVADLCMPSREIHCFVMFEWVAEKMDMRKVPVVDDRFLLLLFLRFARIFAIGRSSSLLRVCCARLRH